MWIFWILATVGVVAAVSSLFLSVAQTIGLLLASVVLVGICAYGFSGNLFDIFLMVVGFGMSALIGAVGLGIAVGLCLRKQRYVMAILLASPFPFFLYQSYSDKEHEKLEKTMALNYVSHNKQLEALVGGPVSASLDSYPGNTHSERGRYEYILNDKNAGYLNAIVEVIRKPGGPKFELLCVTTLSMGKREANKDACDQSPVPLPE
jgi:hypothetical protein